MVYGEQYEDRGKVVLMLSTEGKHYHAVVDTQNPHLNLKLLERLKDYVGKEQESKESKCAVVDDSEKGDLKNASKDDIRMVNSRIDAVLKLFANMQAKFEGKLFRLEEENKALMSLLSSRGSTASLPAKVVVPKPSAPDAVKDTAPMDLDNEEEFPQLQRLYEMKHQGYQRQGPAAPPVRKVFSCALCKVQFADEENLKKHKGTRHTEKKNMEKNESTDSHDRGAIEKKSPEVISAPAINSNEDVLKRIPILNGQSREYNCLECPFQADGKGSSKSLLRHFKQTRHKTSSLEEKCYTCQKVCSDFEELMLHRRENHKDNINFCRYLSEGSCKFDDRCWYSHDQSKKNDNSKQVFRNAKESIPPDMIQGLTVLMSDLIAKHLEKKRPPGA